MNAPVERYVDVPGGRVWTATHGAGSQPTLLVLHGGPGMPSYYLEGLAALADTRRVVFFDQLGCGRSDRPDDPGLWTLSRSIAEVEAVRDQLDLGPVALLGHSWGGFLALAYADSHPDTVTAMVLSSPLVSVAQWMSDAAVLLARLPEDVQAVIRHHEERGTFEAPEYEQATMQFYKKFLCNMSPWPAALDKTFEEMGVETYQAMWGPSEFTQTGNLRGQDLTPVLDRLTLPTLWICGSEDEVLPQTLVRFARRAGGRSAVFEGGTHCLHLEQPEPYMSAVRAFLDAV